MNVSVARMLVVNIFKLIEWSFFILLCIASIMFTHQVWEQYESYDSNYKQSVGQTSESPTVVICFRPVKPNAFEYGRDFNISYIVDADIKNLQILNEGINIIETRGSFVNGTKIKINYEVLDTNFYGKCHKISSDLISQTVWSGIMINFNRSIPKESLPEFQLTISSENNSYGAIFDEYYDGATHSDIGSFDKEIWLKLQSVKFVYLDQSSSPKSKCKKGVYFYECFQEKVLQEIGNNCPSKCFPVFNKKFSIPYCKTMEESTCANYVIAAKIRTDKTFLSKCPRSCVGIEFRKTYKWVGNYVEEFFKLSSQEYAFWFWYKTAEEEELHTEYLIYDFNSMIGSIGGTLGMFIGFSFRNVFTLFFNKLENCLYLYSSQDKN